MYNILIVDDEYLARNKLHFMLDWNKYGFQIAGEACSAVEAIHFMNENAVDIVFADVYMPDMDGIQLAEYIHKNYPEIHTDRSLYAKNIGTDTRKTSKHCCSL